MTPTQITFISGCLLIIMFQNGILIVRTGYMKASIATIERVLKE